MLKNSLQSLKYKYITPNDRNNQRKLWWNSKWISNRTTVVRNGWQTQTQSWSKIKATQKEMKEEEQPFVVLHLWKWYVGCFGFSIFNTKKVIPCAWNFSLVSKISLCSNGNISIAHHYFWFRLSSCPPTPKNGLNSLFSGLLTQPLYTHFHHRRRRPRRRPPLQQHQSKTTTTTTSAMHCFKIYFRKVFWMQLLKLL